MALLTYDDIWINEPRLMIPHRKPLGPLIVRSESQFVAKATNLLLFDQPFLTDRKTGQAWVADTTNGSIPYALEAFDGDVAFVNKDTDEDSIVYRNSASHSGVAAATTPECMLLSFAVLIAPTLANRGVFQVGNVTRDSGPRIGFNSSSATLLKVYVNGGDRFTNIPVSVGKKQYIAYHYNGAGTHTFFSSAKNIGWETYSGNQSNGSATDYYWIGCAYQKELACAFYLYYHSYGWAPSLSQFEAFARNPWPELVVPA